VIVLVPAPVSVTVVRDEDLLPLLTIATNNSTTTIPPTTHTQGAVYHSVCSVVVVFTVVLGVPLSWARPINCKQLSRKVTAKYLKKRVEDKFFIVKFFWLNILERIDSTITPNEKMLKRTLLGNPRRMKPLKQAD